MTSSRTFWHLFKFQFLKIPWFAWMGLLAMFLCWPLFFRLKGQYPIFMSYFVLFPMIMALIWDSDQYGRPTNEAKFLWALPFRRELIFSLNCSLTFLILLLGIARDATLMLVEGSGETLGRSEMNLAFRNNTSFIILFSFFSCWCIAKKQSVSSKYIYLIIISFFYFGWTSQSRFFAKYEPWIWIGVLIFGFFVLRNAKKRYLASV